MARGERDHYDILGVPRDASQKDIQRAYRQPARPPNHPDVNKEPGAEERFKQITKACDTQGDSGTTWLSRSTITSPVSLPEAGRYATAVVGVNTCALPDRRPAGRL